MKLSKDIQEVLEGVHHFLSVTLSYESLSGGSESERRNLLARIESLSHTHPSLTLTRPQSAASLPYLPMDNPPILGIHLQHPSESSSSGSNTYSNSNSSCGGGGSGDGLVMPRVGLAGLGGSHTLPPSFQLQDELYEDFEDGKEEEAVQNGKMERGRDERRSEKGKEEMEEKDDAEEVYMESVEAVPFSTIIATCEKHGVLAKRTKALLRNLKTYHTVVAGGRLYLYLRDTDERQRKTLDLTGYTARSATGDDIKDQRKKDAAFELVGPGKKTHTVGSEESGPPPLPASCVPKQQPPDRPPLPAIIQDRLNQQATRPLPDAPYDHDQDSEDIIGIYCEIDEDVLDVAKQNYEKALQAETEGKSGQELELNKVNKEVKPLGNPAPPLPGRGSGNSLVGYLSDEVLQNISDFSTSSPTRYPSLRPVNNPPKLPPKGLPLVIDDDSEYKVPPASHDNEYQVPSSNPVPTGKESSSESSNVVHNISGPVKSASELYQVPQTQTIVSIKPSERRTSIVKEDVKPLSSFFSSQENPYAKTSFRSLAKHFENMSENEISNEPSVENRLSQGTSVKDMIARLNKTKANSDSLPAKTKEDPVPTTVIETGENNDGELAKTGDSRAKLAHRTVDGRLSKPSLPPRPANLVNGGAVTQLSVPPVPSKQRNSGTSEEADNSSDDYETPDEPSGGSSIHTDTTDTVERGGNVVPQGGSKTEEAGEWYVAKFAFVASIDRALSFSRGEELFVYDTSGASGWWRARLKGQSGLVPREYLRKKVGTMT